MTIKAILFDTFGTVVDWRSSIIAEFTAFGAARGLNVDWAAFADAWRAAYHPSMDKVRRGELPWTILDMLHRTSLDRLVSDFAIRGLDETDLLHLNLVWHRLHPWPDSVAGLTRLKQRFIIGPLSNGNIALLVNLSKFSGLPWDVVFGSETFHHFKPDPEVYLGACALLGLKPAEVMMAAAHNHDLKAAQALGLGTAFFARPTEYGPRQVRDFAPDGAWDVVAADIEDLATRMGC